MPIFLTLLISYLIGSIPCGFLIVKIFNGKDIRKVESGRTGGTNAMRAAGFWAGLLTMAMDILKGVSSYWIVLWLAKPNPWVQIAAAILVIIGHNYSIFLIEKKADGKFHLRGGAGGMPCLGGAIALWPQIWIIILPLAILVFLLIGYASVTTMSIAFFATVVFIYRAITGMSPWIYVIYGILAEVILMWALRPNLKRLKEGTERLVGLRAYLLNKVHKSF